jgi:hypothetical protein
LASSFRLLFVLVKSPADLASSMMGNLSGRGNLANRPDRFAIVVPHLQEALKVPRLA